jgi:hypothetical protein
MGLLCGEGQSGRRLAGCEEGVEAEAGVADVFELVVEVLAVVDEPVLE